MFRWFAGEDRCPEPFDGKGYRKASSTNRILRASALAVCLSCAVCALAWMPSPAHAEEDSDAKVEAEYQQVIADALSEYERGSWEESAALFQRAHALRPSARTLRGLGLAVFEARHYPESIQYLSAALTDSRRPLTPKQREEAESTLRRARLFVGYVKLDVEPSDAQVLINGRDAQPSENGEVITDLGWLDIEVRADGYESQTRRLRMNAGEHQVFQTHLTPHADTVTSGVRPETTEVPATAAPAPALTVTASTAAQPTRATDSSLGTWKWVTAGAAALALGVGATMLVIQKAEAPAYTRQCVTATTPAADCESRERRLGSTLWNGSIVGFAVGGGLAAASVVLFALDGAGSQSERAEPGLRACGVHGTIGVACHWAF